MARLSVSGRRALEDVKVMCGAERPLLDLLAAVSGRLAAELDARAWCASQLAPNTGLLVNSTSAGWPDEAKPMLLERVLLRTPAASPYELFRLGYRAVTVDRLLAHREDLLADPYFEHHLLPFGLRYEVQCMCAARSAPQAILTFSRPETRGEFEPTVLRLLSAVAPHVGAAVLEARSYEAATGSADGEVGVMVLDAEGTVEVANEAARAWLAVSGYTGSERAWEVALPLFAELVRDPGGLVPDAVEVNHPLTGALHRLRAERAGDGRTMLLLTRVRLGESTEALQRAGLTPREADVAFELARGARRDVIAEALGCSPHTVEQHTRSVYDKLGVRSRVELAATLLA